MSKIKKFVMGITTTLLVSGFVLGTSSYTSAEESEELILTQEQQEELDLAKQRTEEVINNWEDVKPVELENLDVNDIGIYAVGSGGDILVTLDTVSSGSSAWAGGHAGIVYDNTTVVESFGNKGDLNGVRKWANDWNTRYDHFKQLRVSGASSTNYSSAKSYASTKVGLPYNYNFFNIDTTSSFYCSQLVWRAWNHQGYDLNDGGAVWPVDLIESSNTYVVYSQ